MQAISYTFIQLSSFLTLVANKGEQGIGQGGTMEGEIREELSPTRCTLYKFTRQREDWKQGSLYMVSGLDNLKV